MTFPIDKNQLISTIIEQLQEELATACAASQEAHASATHSENISDNRYDTLGLEAAYLAHGQSMRITELQQSIDRYRRFQVPEFGPQSPVKLGALVSVESEDGTVRAVFIGPGAGGLSLGAGPEAVQVVTSATPLGQSLLNQHLGDEFTLTINTSSHFYTIVGIS